MPTLTVQARGITLERLVFKTARAFVPGLVERTLEANPGLAGLADELPVGTIVFVPPVTEAERAAAAVEPIRLVD